MQQINVDLDSHMLCRGVERHHGASCPRCGDTKD